MLAGFPAWPEVSVPEWNDFDYFQTALEAFDRSDFSDLIGPCAFFAQATTAGLIR